MSKYASLLVGPARQAQWLHHVKPTLRSRSATFFWWLVSAWSSFSSNSLQPTSRSRSTTFFRWFASAWLLHSCSCPPLADLGVRKANLCRTMSAGAHHLSATRRSAWHTMQPCIKLPVSVSLYYRASVRPADRQPSTWSLAERCTASSAAVQ